MRSVARSALVPYSAEQMFALVDDIEGYPEFLPWCADAEVHSRNDAVVEATLYMRRAGMTQSFRTRNLNESGERIVMQLLDGPFRELAGEWRFEQLGDEGSKVSMSLQFEFNSFLLDTVFGAYLEASCNTLIESFIARASQVYD